MKHPVTSQFPIKTASSEFSSKKSLASLTHSLCGLCTSSTDKNFVVFLYSGETQPSADPKGNIMAFSLSSFFSPYLRLNIINLATATVPTT